MSIVNSLQSSGIAGDNLRPYKSCLISGLSIPIDISIVGYDCINMTKMFNSITYEQDAEIIDIKVAEKLLTLIEKPDLKLEHVIVSGKLIKGNIVRKIKK